MSPRERKNVIAASSAAETAAKVAEQAALVAREVAAQAVATASKVADVAMKTQESVLLFGQDLGYIKSDIAEIKAMIDHKYVTKEELKTVIADRTTITDNLSTRITSNCEGLSSRIGLVEKIVYTLCGLILVAFVGGLVSLVIKR